MKALAFERYGDNSVLRLMERPLPEVGARDVRVRIEAASVNPLDFKIRSGALKRVRRYPLPQILGNDFAGVVDQVGAEVTRFKVGDPVFARVSKDRVGSFAEWAASDEGYVAHRPRSLSAVDAAALALAGLTAWQGLTEVLKLQRGETVLIHAGAGGVGSLAIQLARHLRARVITTASGAGLELTRKLGADEVIDYRSQRFEDHVRGVDAVFDTVGEDTRARSFQVLARGGRMVSINGMPTPKFAAEEGLGWVARTAIALLHRKTARAAERAGVSFTYLFMRPSGSQLEQLAALSDRGSLKPLVDRTFPLEQGAEAVDYVERGKAKGKVVITMNGAHS